MKTTHLLFGAAYYDEYMPYDRLEEDMAMMQKAGMNVIRIAESTWSTLEPQEGEFHFAHIDRMLHAAARHGIEVIIGTPTYAIPSWLAAKADDMLVTTKDGTAIYGHRQNMDITNPIYRRHAEQVIRALLSHVQDIPNVIGFQIDNETKHYNTAGPRAQQMFVTYLKDKYPDIHEFNREFGLDYWSNRIDDWNYFPDIRGTINGSLAAEFEKFQRSLVTEFFQWQASIIQEYLRPGQFITHNFDFEWHNYSFGLQPDVDQFDAARCMTVSGADIYHPSQDDLTGFELTFCGNVARGLKKENYLILETQAQGLAEWLPYPKQLRLCAYSHIANGSNSVMYWHWHSIHNSFESYWKGVLSHNFSENATYREACQIGAEFARIGSHLKNIVKKNDVAIMVDNLSLTGQHYFPTGELGDYSYNTIVRWLADSLCRQNIEYDIIHSSDDNLSDYKMILIPALYSASEKTLSNIRDFVASGGTAVVTFRSGFSDSQLKIHCDMQPHGLRECLGIHYDQFTTPRQTKLAFGDKFQTSDSFDIKHWMELVTPDTAEVLAYYKDCAFGDYAAITENSYGRGHAFYLSCFFETAALDAFLAYAASTARIELPEVTYPVLIKKGTNDLKRHLVYYFNYSGKPVSCPYSYKDGRELLSGQAVCTNDMLDIPAWDVRIIEY